MFHYLQNFSLDDQLFDDFCHSHKSNSCLISSIWDYDLGGEDDLFKAPEPIIEPPYVTLDHMTSAISMISCAEDPMLQVNDAESLQSVDFLSDLLVKETSSPSEVLNNCIFVKEDVHAIGQMMKSVSSDSLRAQIGPGFLTLPKMELETVHGMRRVLSEGYIKPSHAAETRMQKLSRYRDKKTKRNFGRKIKYACRKALADGQPRVRGRFAKTEETETTQSRFH